MGVDTLGGTGKGGFICSSARRGVTCAASMRTASRPAFAAFPIATVATGIPVQVVSK